MRALGDQVLVRRDVYDEHADNPTIVIPDTGRMSIFGTVVAVGPKVTELKANDRIVIPGWNGKKLTVGGEPLWVLHEQEIPCVVE